MLDSYLQKLADSGDLNAQICLAKAYWNGQGVEQDYTRAFYYYMKAAEQGDSEAQEIVGDCYNYGMGTISDNEKAIYWYKKAAEQNNPGAIFALAVEAHGEYRRYEELKYEGLFLTREDEENNARLVREKYYLAMDLYEYAASLGYIDAQKELEKLRRGYKLKEMFGDEWIDYEKLAAAGENYVFSTKTEDVYDGLTMLRSAQHENRMAKNYFDDTNFLMNRCGVLMNSHNRVFIKLAVEILDMLCEKGVVTAMLNMAYYYSTVAENAPDYVNLFRYIKKAAEYGDADAQHRLAQSYINGLGTDKDIQEALRWEKAAADKNHETACLVLGVYYLSGDLGVQDCAEGFRYVKKSAELGLLCGMEMVGELYRHGIGTERDEYKAFAWFKKAEESYSKDKESDNGGTVIGNIQLNLAISYFYGYGVEADCKLAKYYLDAASANGQSDRIDELCQDDNDLYDFYKGFGLHKLKEELVLYSKIAGITYDNRQIYARNCYIGQELKLIRDKFNKYDKNAVAVYENSRQLGFVPKDTAVTIAKLMDEGTVLKCYVEDINHGGYSTIGINIKITKVISYSDIKSENHKNKCYDDEDDHRSEGFYMASDGKWYEEGDEPDYYEDEY